MPNFLVVLSATGERAKARSLFKHGLGNAYKYFDFQSCGTNVEDEGLYAASFQRLDGSGSPIANDPESGSWLLAAGTWFYDNKFGNGDESHLLKSYLQTDLESVSAKLDGFYNFLIRDERSNELVVANDIAGSLYCFVRDFGNIVAISSSSLLLAALDDWTLDPVGCQEFLYCGTIYENRTFFNEVKRLSPATIYRFSEGKLKSSTRYWHASQLNPAAINNDRAVRLLEESLCDGIANISRVFRNPICDLTGGYDSRLVFSSFLSSGLRPPTFVAGFPEDKDVQVSRAISEEFDVPHLHFLKKSFVPFSDATDSVKFTDGEFDLLEYSQIKDAQEFSLDNGYDLSVIGNFGELSRGKHWKKKLLPPDVGACAPIDAWQAAKYNFHAAYTQDDSLFPPETRIDPISQIAEVVKRENAGLEDRPNTLQMDNIYLYMKMRCWYGRIASSTEKIRPCISLFQLRSVVETMLQIDWRLRQKNSLLNKILAESQPLLANIPLEDGCPAATISWRNFYRFSPLLKVQGLRALRFAKRKLAGNTSAGSVLGGNSGRIRLWHDQEVQDLLDPAKMNVGQIMEADALSSFLKRSQEEGFLYDKQWRWLLSLEQSLAFLNSIDGKRLGAEKTS